MSHVFSYLKMISNKPTILVLQVLVFQKRNAKGKVFQILYNYALFILFINYQLSNQIETGEASLQVLNHLRS